MMELNRNFLQHSEALRKFKQLRIKKNMPNRDVLGIMLREDSFLNTLSGNLDEIRKIWKQEIG